MKENRVKNVLFFLAALPFAFFFVFPYIWTLSLSFKPLGEIFSFPPSLIPENFTIDNYKTILTDPQFLESLANSVISSGLYVFLGALICSLAGYSFAKFNFRFKNILFLIAVGSMMIPMHITIIPLFVEINAFNLIDTFIALTLPFTASAFGLFFIRQSMSSVPDEILDSARIDGASEIRIFFKIVFPLMKGPISALAIVLFIFSWNSFMWPSIITHDRFTLPVYLYRLTTANNVEFNLLIAASVLSIIPVALIFIFVQKQFVEGLTAGALKQ